MTTEQEPLPKDDQETGRRLFTVRNAVIASTIGALAWIGGSWFYDECQKTAERFDTFADEFFGEEPNSSDPQP